MELCSNPRVTRVELNLIKLFNFGEGREGLYFFWQPSFSYTFHFVLIGCTAFAGNYILYFIILLELYFYFKIWAVKCFIPQTLHFFYGFGALLSPVIAEPFLRSACENGHFESNIFGWTLENSTFTEEFIDELVYNYVNISKLNFTRATRVTLVKMNTRPFVQYAYWIVASLQVSRTLN